VAIGGEDTLGVAARLHAEHELPVVGVPEDDRQRPLGHRLHLRLRHRGLHLHRGDRPAAHDRESHNRVMVLEVMGRHTGWIAVVSGIAGGADVILIPEHPVSIEDTCKEIQSRHDRGKDFSIVVVSEGYELEGGGGQEGEVDQFGHARLSERGIGARVAHEIEQRTGFETRVTVLGHVQRGGSPRRATACSRRATG
jgi:6-phosphofructokinase 1